MPDNACSSVYCIAGILFVATPSSLAGRNLFHHMQTLSAPCSWTHSDRTQRFICVTADVRWFEIDRSDVTQAKDRALAAVGAQTTELPAAGGSAGVCACC